MRVAYIVWSSDHGIEPGTFDSQGQAEQHIAKLRDFAAYRNTWMRINRLEAGRTNLDNLTVYDPEAEPF